MADITNVSTIDISVSNTDVNFTERSKIYIKNNINLNLNVDYTAVNYKGILENITTKRIVAVQNRSRIPGSINPEIIV